VNKIALQRKYRMVGAFLALLLIVFASLACNFGIQLGSPTTVPSGSQSQATLVVPTEVQSFTPTLTASPRQTSPPAANMPIAQASLVDLHNQLNPGVVNIQVLLRQAGQTGGAEGSGFIIDDAGHIITNNHVVDGAYQVTVIFYNGLEEEAQIVGTDVYSDLAVLKVDKLLGDAHPLTLGDSDMVETGQWVIAIGNPFGLTSSMSVGIVSAVGRTIPSGATRFGIPQSIQTDAAINPGNSGGPLLDLSGQVIGVNAQIQTSGTQANSGVGFAIPSNIVRMVAPMLIQEGVYQWPWLGVSGGSLSLLSMKANNLDIQQGAYIDTVEPGGPAEKAGLQGSTGTDQVNGIPVPVGGDVVTAIDGNPVNNFDDLLVAVAFRKPGDTVTLTIIRNGSRQQVPVTLEPRPVSASPNQ
jgi:S1-C subfamily serine protease